ncbi:MAG TPA: TIGR01777 family oxidoreductase [Chitinophagaceae bacterium]|nr:TIGR01777 family oxidoreductase [Chitinophagaceae bacterium]
MATILITGGTGLVGSALTKALLAKGHKVIIIGRGTKESRKQAAVSGLEFAKWDLQKQEIDAAAFGKADVIIHLAGAGVADKRWTTERKKEIVDSRVNSGALLVKSLDILPNKIKTVISASAIGWYGADQKAENNSFEKFTENDRPSNDFLGETCRKWEESIEPVISMGLRLVKLRIGIVLSTEGGALKEFLKPLRFGIASILGSGRQIISWVHIDDLVNMFLKAVEDETFSGVYNAVAPAPVSNRDLILSLAKARKSFYIPVPVPSFILKLMLGEMSVEILKSATVSAEKIQGAGFNFIYPDIKSAVRSFFYQPQKGLGSIVE